MGKRPGRRLVASAVALFCLASVVVIAAPSAAAKTNWPNLIVAPDPLVAGQTATVAIAFVDVDRPSSEWIWGCPNDVTFTWQSTDGQYFADTTYTIPADDNLNDGTASPSIEVLIPAGIPEGTTIAFDALSNCDHTDVMGPWLEVVGGAEQAEPQVTLAPGLQQREVGESATVTAKVVDGLENPLPGQLVRFNVDDGSVPTGRCAPTNCTTGPDGTVAYTYAAGDTGSDMITADTDVAPTGGTAIVDWVKTGSVYAALGDSYSAGEGSGVYYDGTDVPSRNMCHRSLLAYSQLLVLQLNPQSDTFRACSGAVTDDLFDRNHQPNFDPTGGAESAQLCRRTAGDVAACAPGTQPAIGPNTKTITLTIGGNDAGFETVLKQCLWLSAAHLNKGKPGRNCLLKSAVYQPTYKRIAALAGFANGTVSTPVSTPIHSYSQILKAIHTAAPKAKVYIAGYPRLFQARSGDCTVGSLTTLAGTYPVKLTPQDAVWLDSLADLLNAAARTAAATAGSWATYVDVTSTFTGHGLCGSNSWITQVSGRVVLGDPSGDLTGTDTNPESIHPTRAGQEAYARAFRAAGISFG